MRTIAVLLVLTVVSTACSTASSDARGQSPDHSQAQKSYGPDDATTVFTMRTVSGVRHFRFTEANVIIEGDRLTIQLPVIGTEEYEGEVYGPTYGIVVEDYRPGQSDQRAMLDADAGIEDIDGFAPPQYRGPEENPGTLRILTLDTTAGQTAFEADVAIPAGGDSTTGYFGHISTDRVITVHGGPALAGSDFRLHDRMETATEAMAVIDAGMVFVQMRAGTRAGWLPVFQIGEGTSGTGDGGLMQFSFARDTTGAPQVIRDDSYGDGQVRLTILRALQAHHIALERRLVESADVPEELTPAAAATLGVPQARLSFDDVTRIPSLRPLPIR